MQILHWKAFRMTGRAGVRGSMIGVQVGCCERRWHARQRRAKVAAPSAYSKQRSRRQRFHDGQQTSLSS